MAQHDYVIDNSTGANVRADINNVLLAISSNNSGSSAPSTTYALQSFANTNTTMLQLRNAANNAFVNLRKFDGSCPLPDGSVSSPSLFFDDDTNTGIFSSAADTFNVATGGVERMELGATTIFNESGADVDFRIEGDSEANLFYVDAGNDRIGIGTSSPQVLMHLHQAGARLQFTNTNTGSASGDGIIMGINGDNDFFINNQESNEHILIFTEGTEVARFTDEQRLLVGTSTASTVGNSQYSKFEVCGNTSSATGASALTIKAGTTTASQTNGNTLGRLIFSTLDGGDYAYIQASIDGAMGSNDFPARLMFFTCADNSSTASERMRIRNDGNVGIGTTNPTTPLHIKGAGGTLNVDSDPQLVIETTATDGAANKGTGILFLNHDGSSGAFGGSIQCLKTNSNNSDQSNYLRFSTRLNNQAVKEGMRLTEAQRLRVNCDDMTSDPSSSNKGVMIGNTSSGTSFSNGASTGFSNNIIFLNGNGVVGTITTNGSNTAYNTSSDYRLKENATAISDGITRLKTLKPYRFNFKADASTTVDGFFAHEVTAVPEAITGTKDEVDSDNKPVYQGIDQSKLVPLLVAAVKELIGKVEALEAA